MQETSTAIPKKAGLRSAIVAAAAGAALAMGAPASANDIDPLTWVYGPRNNDTTGGLIWNPAKTKLLAGGDLVGRTMQSNNRDTMNTTYCTLASEVGADFTWTEMQHSGIDWGDTWRMWAYGSSAACANRRAIPGTRIAYTDEREIQHALDGGAMVLVVPTVDTAAEAREVVQWAYFPPFGKRSQGGSQTAAVLAPWIPAGVNYRQTFNNNLVLIVMVETIEGVKNAREIAAVPGVHAVFAASGDLGNFSGWQEGDAQYERLITAIKEVTLKEGKRLCGPFRWVDRPGFTCFQN